MAKMNDKCRRYDRSDKDNPDNNDNHDNNQNNDNHENKENPDNIPLNQDSIPRRPYANHSSFLI